MKCRICNSELVKKDKIWQYHVFQVRLYKCDKCDTFINVYYKDNKVNHIIYRKKHWHKNIEDKIIEKIHKLLLSGLSNEKVREIIIEENDMTINVMRISKLRKNFNIPIYRYNKFQSNK
jgi:hypothetical protein